jgi:hypothetical protein
MSTEKLDQGTPEAEQNVLVSEVKVKRKTSFIPWLLCVVIGGVCAYQGYQLKQSAEWTEIEYKSTYVWGPGMGGNFLKRYLKERGFKLESQEVIQGGKDPKKLEQIHAEKFYYFASPQGHMASVDFSVREDETVEAVAIMIEPSSQ